MKIFVVISIFASVALCQVELGSHNYQYITDNINRNEIRNQDGTVSGSYKFIDGQGLTHDVEYTSGIDQGFKVTSHLVTGNGRTFSVNSGYIPEVQTIDDSQIFFQNYLRTVLPQINDADLPPVYIRHVPSPVKNEPIVPIIEIPQLQRQSRQLLDQQQKAFVVNDIPIDGQIINKPLPLRQARQVNNQIKHEYTPQGHQKVVVVEDIPVDGQLGGARAQSGIPEFIESKAEEAKVPRSEQISVPQEVAQFVQQRVAV